ncbi:MAG: alpha-L-fucosidase [Bryobacteraceae bacterium]
MITRRSALAGLAGAAPTLRMRAAEARPRIAQGPFSASRDSLRAYRVPDWFRDAKFGIWAHWGPQSAPEFGDWYARNMYIEGHRQYKYHIATYGHPSKFGFKDIIPTWKAEKFDPAALISLYKKAGAKYFVSMGVHHDNFDLWKSRHNRWNSVNMGPKRDIVGEFRREASRQGLRFGVSEHLAVTYHWFQTSHGADKSGPFAGVPYDGADPKFADYYLETHEAPKNAWEPQGVPLKWKQHYFDRVKDLLDRYEPDLLYTDGPIFFEDWGLAVAAHHYNKSAARAGGAVEGVYANKGKTDCVNGTCVLDLERGVVDRIWDEPWQTDTCVGRWHYDKEARYKSPKIVIDMLVDIVSRNGNLLLNFPLPSSGMLDPEELKILDEISRWMAINGEAIYGTRPWKAFGGGPSTEKTPSEGGGQSAHHNAAAFNERSRKDLVAADVRYTSKAGAVYAFSMGWGGHSALFPELAAGKVGNIGRVVLLGHRGSLEWKQESAGLRIGLPPARPCEHAVAFRVEGA